MGLDKIKTLMKIRGLTSEGLAEISGVPKSTIDKIMSGNTDNPKFKTVQSIANALCLTIDEFTELIYFKIKKPQNSSEFYIIKEQEAIKKYRYLNENGKEIIELLDKLTDEQILLTKGYIIGLVQQNEAVGTKAPKQTTNTGIT